MKNSNWSLYTPNFLLIYDAVGVDSEKMMRWKCSSFFTNRFTLWRMELEKKTHLDKFLYKSPIFSRNSICRASGLFFSDSLRNFRSKTPLFLWKKIIFRYFIHFIEFFKLFSLFFTTTTSLSQIYRFRRKKIPTHMLKMVAYSF